MSDKKLLPADLDPRNPSFAYKNKYNEHIDNTDKFNSYLKTNEVKKILGTKPYFVGIDAWLTLPPHKKMSNYDEIGSHVSSQMWHRDCDNLRDIKVMTYLTDVKNLDEGKAVVMDLAELIASCL